ncbi:MAG: SH3 domain-containing protein, partial [Candidatus Omnitrophica bacterium]|nr:SH3 domain-containing protein [Candidatus Omnitrophota bacterium]
MKNRNARLLLTLICAGIFTAYGYAQEQKETPSQQEQTEETSSDTTSPVEVEVPGYMEFEGEVNSDGVNIRSDSTVSSETICTVDKIQVLEVVSDAFDWYKVRLPEYAPSYIKGDFLAFVEPTASAETKESEEKDTAEAGVLTPKPTPPQKIARLLKDSVNIRLGPNTKSAILGRVNKNDEVFIIAEEGDWYRIKPIAESYGWIHKDLLNKVEKKVEVVEAPPEATEEPKEK